MTEQTIVSNKKKIWALVAIPICCVCITPICCSNKDVASEQKVEKQYSLMKQKLFCKLNTKTT